jgi:hypothetical protein
MFSPAFAAVNFRKAGFSVVTTPGSANFGKLDCSWDVSGLGTSPIFVTCTAATATAHYQCINQGGNPPPGQTSTGAMLDETAGPITPTKNGRASGDVFVSPPPGTACPDQMTLALVDATYCTLTIDVKTSDSVGATLLATFHSDQCVSSKDQ